MDQEAEKVPQRLGSYRIIAKLGQGGMASVFLGMQSGMAKFKKLVVLKLLHPKHAENAEFLEMFLNEARLAARLNHPHVVNTYEVGEDQQRHFIAMEYLEGQPYSAIIKKVGRRNLTLEHALKVLIDVLDGLHYAHELRDFDGTHLGVVHRDISPQNIFVTYDGNVKLVDFGVAKAACSDTETKAGVIKGKIAYLAPEQAGNGPVDRRADLFSTGVLLWEALAGRRFSSGSIDVATIHNRVTGAEPRILQVAPDTPADLAAICDKAIALSPDDRYATALELRTALETVLEARRERNKSHSLALLVNEHFAEERSTIKTVIEEHARDVHSEPPSNTTGRNLIPTINPRNGTSEISASVPSVASTGAASVGGIDARPTRGSVIPWIATVATVGIAGATIAYVVGQKNDNTLVSPTQSSSVVAAAPLDDAETVELVILASPPEAILTLDGTPVAGNPFRAEVERGPRPHRISARADGFEPQEKVVVFDQKKITVTISLTRVEEDSERRLPTTKPGRPGTPPLPADPAKNPATGTPPVAAGDRLSTEKNTGKPTRTIDDKDPYAQ